MLQTTVAFVVILGLVVAGLLVANALVDRGVSSYVARRVPATLGGVAFLVAVLWLDAGEAILLSGVLSVGIVALRLRIHDKVRGVRDSLPSQHWVEITYSLAGTASLGVGWGMLGDRWLAFVPIAFMAWGDTMSGLVTELKARCKAIIGLWPSAAMLASCLTIALFFHQYWVGVVGGIVATTAERFTPKVLGVQDDNCVIVGVSLGVMAAIQAG